MDFPDDVSESMGPRPVIQKGNKPNRTSLSDKLTGVRNSQSEKFLAVVHKHYDTQLWNLMRNYKAETSRVKMEFQTLQVDQKKNEIENKKRFYPDEDIRADEMYIHKSEKYLSFNEKDSWYLKKTNPLRLRSYCNADHITPALAQARKMLQDVTVHRRVEAMNKRSKSIADSRASHLQSVRFNLDESGDGADQLPPIQNGIFDMTEVNNNKTEAKGEPKKVTIVESEPCSSDNVSTTSSAKDTSSQSTCTEPHHPTKLTKEEIRAKLQQMGIIQQRHQTRSASVPSTARDTPHRKSQSAGKRPRVTQEVLYTEQVDIQLKINKFFLQLEDDKQREAEIEAMRQREEIRRMRRERGEESSETDTDGETDYAGGLAALIAKEKRKKLRQERATKMAAEKAASQALKAVDTMQKSKHLSRTIDANSKWKRVTVDQLSKIDQEFPQGMPDLLPSHMALPPPPENHKSGPSQLALASMAAQQKCQEETPTRGAPKNSAMRSQRHSATFKLQKLVRQVIREKSKRELMEYDKIKQEMGGLAHSATENGIQVL